MEVDHDGHFRFERRPADAQRTDPAVTSSIRAISAYLWYCSGAVFEALRTAGRPRSRSVAGGPKDATRRGVGVEFRNHARPRAERTRREHDRAACLYPHAHSPERPSLVRRVEALRSTEQRGLWPADDIGPFGHGRADILRLGEQIEAAPAACSNTTSAAAIGSIASALISSMAARVGLRSTVIGCSTPPADSKMLDTTAPGSTACT